MKTTQAATRGFALIETLIAILVFSIAIIGVTIFQGSALKESGEARSRSEATMIANQIIGDLWAGSAVDPTALEGTYSATSNSTEDWAKRVAALLPNGQAIVTVPAKVSTGTGTTSYQVTVRIEWTPLGDATAHALEYQALINNNGT